MKGCCFRYHKGTDFQANHNTKQVWANPRSVVLDTTKVQIFKQITTASKRCSFVCQLFQIPQRYRFSSKSQPNKRAPIPYYGCFRYHKGTDFQANHNSTDLVCLLMKLFQIPQRYRFSSKSQRFLIGMTAIYRCFRYHKGTDFQANHNRAVRRETCCSVVLDTTKVQIFKQITTTETGINQRRFVVLDTTKVQIFKQITTPAILNPDGMKLFQIPQRYRFSSKSQPSYDTLQLDASCFRYHKGTDFQANHNC